jgi:hypothetical protein
VGYSAARCSRPVVKLLALTVVGAAVVGVSGCASETQVSPQFARTSAEAIFDADTAYPVNLLFVADSGDRIWNSLAGVAIAGGASFGPGEFEVHRGEDDSQSEVGNITFSYPGTEGESRFSEMELYFEREREPVVVDVGDWSLEPQPSVSTQPPLKGAIAAMSECGSYEVVFADEDQVDPEPDFVVGTEGMQLQDASVTEREGYPRELAASATMACSSEYDLYVASPRVIGHDQEGDEVIFQSSPVAIGFTSIDDAALARIRAR